MSGVPYHAWTHRPKSRGGTDPMETVSVFRAYASGVDAIIEDMDSGNGFTIPWNWWHNCDPRILIPLDNDSGDPPEVGTDIVEEIRLKAPGRYIFTVGVLVNPTVTGCSISFNDGDPLFGYSEDHFSGPTIGYDSPGLVTTTFSLVYPKVDPFDGSTWPDFGAGGFADVFWTVAVLFSSGANRELEFAFLEITHDFVHDCTYSVS